jgi:hypothetical protein
MAENDIGKYGQAGSVELPKPSDFEVDLGLTPMGDDLLERVRRIETILGVVLAAALNNTTDKATVWVGVLAPHEVRLPVPSVNAVNDVLRPFSTKEQIEMLDFDDETSEY